MSIVHHSDGLECDLCNLKIEQAHPILQAWFKKIKGRYINTHLSWVYRDQESQELAFQSGHSKLHFPDSAHNLLPAMAVDLFQIDEDGVARFSWPFYKMISQVSKQEMDPIQWGGEWKALGDADHFQLITGS